jgi:hypothetical protein
LEGFFPVDGDTHAPARRCVSSSSTSGSGNPCNAPAFVSQIEEILGANCGPDPLFFVESWSVGIFPATQNLHARREAATRDFEASSFRPFDFSVPLWIEEEETRDLHSFSSISAAWRDAYGVCGSSSPASAIQQDDAAFNACPAGKPLTPEIARRVLGLGAMSTRDEIKTAYRRLVRRYHPDRLELVSERERRIATERMISINEAYHLLSGASLLEST